MQRLSQCLWQEQNSSEQCVSSASYSEIFQEKCNHTLKSQAQGVSAHAMRFTSSSRSSSDRTDRFMQSQSEHSLWGSVWYHQTHYRLSAKRTRKNIPASVTLTTPSPSRNYVTWSSSGSSSRNSLYNISCRTLSTGVIDKQRDNISTNANIIVSTPSITLKVNNSLQAQHRQIRLRNQMKSIINQLTTQFNDNSKL